MKTLTTLSLTTALLLVFATSAFANCGAAADSDPALPGVSLKAARSATLCLLNVERAKRHEQPLRFNHKLALAGLRHALDMVHRRYFSHTTPTGQNFVQRILNTNYVPPATKFLVGENLAWGKPDHATPRQVVAAWMHSREHRHNILTRGFRQIGIAIVVGAPVNGVAQGATYATEFGAIRHTS